jgi:hypothetical protein
MNQETKRTAHARQTVLSAQPTLAVYAPFGNDTVISTFPDGQTQDVVQHPLVRNLCAVADSGVNVLLLIDREDDSSHLVQIPAGRSADLIVESQGKLDMLSHRTLADFLALAHRQFPEASLVLTFEGHGAGFLPELDRWELAAPRVAETGDYEWRVHNGVTRVFHCTGPHAGEPAAHMGAPVLPAGNPTMPAGNPTMPTGHAAISTWALGAGLGVAGIPRISVIHFNNCFNMSVEVLHTVAPYADFATGYCNYNFFTAGQSYPAVFERLAAVGSATSEQLAKWFAAENHRVLAEAGHEPTVAGTVDLARMHEIAEKVDGLSDALLAALRKASPAERPVVVSKIQQAIVASQQYDSRADNQLDAPDELTDLDSLASELMKVDFGHGRIAATAEALRTALSGIKQYGDEGSPWMAPGAVWDFSSKNLAMNIFLPDPMLNGLWDWRSQYYLNVNPDPTKPQVQRHVIDFLKETDWVDFLIEYHKDTPFIGLLPAVMPDMPLLHSKVDPRRRGASSKVAIPAGEATAA